MSFSRKMKSNPFKASFGLAKSLMLSLEKKNNICMNFMRIDDGRIGPFGVLSEKVLRFNVSLMGSKNADWQRSFVVTCIANGEISAGIVCFSMLYFVN